jgi:tRNA-specific 2-thiouridylase
MSGGVDSSVVAALLKREGYDVIGVTLQLYDHGAAVHRAGACCAGQDIHDARRVAEAIGIPHYVLDYESRFREAVIERFAESYLAGETPIPCVECNRTVKFRDLLGLAQELGADALATGHYVVSRDLGTAIAACSARPTPRATRAISSMRRRRRSSTCCASARQHRQGADPRAGRRTRARHRRQARQPGHLLRSQWPLCRCHREAEARRLRPGEIVHLDGRVLGRHDGVLRYTVGQRKGLGLSAPSRSMCSGSMPISARVVVGPREALGVREISLRDVNWLGDMSLDALPTEGLDVAVRVRSTRAPREARLIRDEDGLKIELASDEEGVSPGQACVIYTDAGPDARVLGGGTILRPPLAMLRLPLPACAFDAHALPEHDAAPRFPAHLNRREPLHVGVS